jgi:O-antigen ligase
MLFSGGVSVCGFFLIFVLPLILQALGRDVTLSGRTVVWKAVMLSIVKRPWLGYGFYAFWQGAKGESAVIIAMLHWVFGYAHNGILEIALQLGVVGVVLFLASLVQALRNASVCIKNGALPQVQWFVSIIILTILYNSDEATVLWPNDLLSILYIVAYCGLSAKASEIRRDLTIALQSQSSIVATVPEEVVAVP